MSQSDTTTEEVGGGPMVEEPKPLTEEEIVFVREMMKKQEFVRLFWLHCFRWGSILGGLFTFFFLVWDFLSRQFGGK